MFNSYPNNQHNYSHYWLGNVLPTGVRSRREQYLERCLFFCTVGLAVWFEVGMAIKPNLVRITTLTSCCREENISCVSISSFTVNFHTNRVVFHSGFGEWQEYIGTISQAKSIHKYNCQVPGYLSEMSIKPVSSKKECRHSKGALVELYWSCDLMVKGG